MTMEINPEAKSRVGIEHIGITVPDILEATRYFEHVFGAEVMFDFIPREDAGKLRERADMLDACDGLDYAAVLGAPSDARIGAMRMLGLGNGPLIELFEYKVTDQRSPAVPSDLGFQHLCVYVDDIDGTAARIVETGGRLLDGPLDLFGPEGGEGNRFMYTRTPWGSTVELITYPSPMPSEETTEVLRPARRL